MGIWLKCIHFRSTPVFITYFKHFSFFGYIGIAMFTGLVVLVKSTELFKGSWLSFCVKSLHWRHVWIDKVGCAYPMVLLTEFQMGQQRDDDHQGDAPHFMISYDLPHRFGPRNINRQESNDGFYMLYNVLYNMRNL